MPLLNPSRSCHNCLLDKIGTMQAQKDGIENQENKRLGVVRNPNSDGPPSAFANKREEIRIDIVKEDI